MPMTREQSLAHRLSPWAETLDATPDQKLILDKSVISQSGDCWDWYGYTKPNGYGRLTAYGTSHHAHRFSLRAFKGMDVGPSVDVCHSCDNRRRVNPAHLFVGSRLDNMRDAQTKGRMSTGKKHGDAVRVGIAKTRNKNVVGQ